MKIQSMFAVAVMALALVAIPAEAQTGKDKRAAKKEKWEMEQRHQKEEAELRHQQRMDSIANADKARKEAAARAEEKRRAEEADAKAKQKRDQQMADLQEVDVEDEPCTEAGTTEMYVRSRGIGESLQHQMARTKAQTNALRDLGAKVGTTVKALIKLYSKEETIDVMMDEKSSTGMQYSEVIEGIVKQKVNQDLSFSTFCEKTRTFIKNNRKVYKCYMTVQVGKEELLKPIYEQIQQDENLKLNVDYNRFSEEFDKEFNKGEIE